MITKFEEFILERSGFPDAIKPYADLIIKHCMERVDKYFARKGKFANYSETFDITREEIKNVIKTPEEFINYPVETISIKFTIKILDMVGELPAPVGEYFPITRNENSYNIHSFYEESKSGLLDESLHLRLTFGLILAKNAKSHEISKNLNFIKSVVYHELIHSYEDFKKEEILNPFTYTIHNISDMYENRKVILDTGFEINIYNYMWDFLYNAYLIDKSEQNAYIGNTYDNKDASKNQIKYLKEFDAEKIYNKILKDCEKYDKMEKGSGEFLINTLNELGPDIVEEYIEQCKEYELIPKKSILKLKNMTYKQILDSYEPEFHKIGEYMQRKINKLQYSK